MPLVVRLRSVVCLLGRFPALAGVDLDVRARRDRAPARRRTARARPRCSGCSPGSCRSTRARPRCSAHDLTVDRAERPAPARPRRSRDVLLRRPDRAGEPPVRRPAPPASATTRTPTIDRLGLAAGAPISPTAALGRPAPPPRARRSRSSATRSCCCSTSRTPVSTPRAARCSHEIVAAAPAEGRTVVMASHELDLARPLATREVRVDSGQAAVVARRRDAASTGERTAVSVWREASLVAGKDLRIEARSRVTLRADPAVRPDRDPAVRVRARPRPGRPGPRRARPVLGRGAARRAARDRPRVRDRGAAQRPRRAPPLRARRRGDLPRQGERDRASSCSRSRSCSGAGVVLLYDVDVHGVGILVLTAAGRDHRPGGHRYPLRRARGRVSGCARRCCRCCCSRCSRR